MTKKEDKLKKLKRYNRRLPKIIYKSRKIAAMIMRKMKIKLISMIKL